ncbi:Hypothetical protein SMAX5B_003967 [Scophthalmus maximus]|uniref:Uncharacterized protein n=1 Tax=Scophthalmus maximus TaxID=52904 RepID=A0A2U9BX32_SCOMX|nr:Hypothetical protein SMAX5B_003964 [Scophthalmus maximus]AWP08889.1 Hypothetical protein SMAX5B_003967 [Scophthalmus maximus]
MPDCTVLPPLRFVGVAIGGRRKEAQAAANQIALKQIFKNGSEECGAKQDKAGGNNS